MSTQRKPSTPSGERSSASSALPRAGGNQTNAFVGILLGVSTVYLSISARKKAMVYLVWIAALSIVSALYDFDTAHSYWTQKHNIFNQYGVKIGWFWTLICVSPFVWFASKAVRTESAQSLGDVARVGVATALWYFTVQVFHRILHVTSRCDVGGITVGRGECSTNGGKWLIGLDISGHCFLMLFSMLIISEEAPALRAFLKAAKERPEQTREYQAVVSGSFIAMALLHFFWDFQLIISCLYYHIMFDKVAGAATAVGCWVIIYRILGRSGLLPLPVGTESKKKSTVAPSGNRCDAHKKK